MPDSFLSPLHQTVLTTRTELWNDSCSSNELDYAIANGAVGATSNPTIVLNVLKHDLTFWKPRINELILQNPTWSEVDITWKIYEEIGLLGSRKLLPIFEKNNGRNGRLSLQTNPANYRNSFALIEQSVYFNTLAPNIQAKLPVTESGVKAIEEVTYLGISINATVCFTIPQSIAVAEAVERGINRRISEGLSINSLAPVCTIMVGRLDDWLKVVARKDGIVVSPEVLDWAGVACLKKAYKIFIERKYRTRLLIAGFRNHLHWSEFIGGDVILTIPYEWQLLFNKSDIEVKERMENPVPKSIIESLYLHFNDFRKAYDEDGLPYSEFDMFGPSRKTLRGFIDSYHELQALIRDVMIPNPDK